MYVCMYVLLGFYIFCDISASNKFVQIHFFLSGLRWTVFFYLNGNRVAVRTGIYNNFDFPVLIREPSCADAEMYPNKSFPSMSRYQQRYILGWLFIRVGYSNLGKKKFSNCSLLKKWYLQPTMEPLFRGHPRNQGKCPLNRGVSWIEVGLGFVHKKKHSNKIFFFYSASIGICYSHYFKQLDNAPRCCVLNSHKLSTSILVR